MVDQIIRVSIRAYAGYINNMIITAQALRMHRAVAVQSTSCWCIRIRAIDITSEVSDTYGDSQNNGGKA